MASFDTIIIGGGPAGSTAAALLVEAGQKVLVVEREKFPRFHVGESLIPYGNDVLHQLGLWHKMEEAGFVPKMGAEFTLGNAAGFQRFRFGKNLGPRYAQTFQVERSKFDELLLRNAEEKGAQVEEGAKVTALLVRGEGVEISYEKEGKLEKANGHWLLDASGRTAVAAQSLGLEKSDLGMPKRLAIFAHFIGVPRPSDSTAGDIVIVRLENAWCWLIPLEGNKTSIGYVQLLADFKARKVDIEESFSQAVAEHAELRRRLKTAQRVTPFYSEGEYTFRFEEAAGPRWLLAGDAAGFIDPIFSSGVMVALRSSQLAARAILKADKRGRPLSPRESRQYTRKIKKMTDSFLQMIRMFYDRDAFEVFMRPSPFLDLPRGVLNLVGGNTDLPWSLRWRTWAFFVICWLQRYMTITPRLSFGEMVPSKPQNPLGQSEACPPTA